MFKSLRNSNEYVFSMFTKVIVVIISLIQQILIARFLGASIKGEVSYIQNLIGVISIIVAMGLHHAYPVFRKDEAFSKSKQNYFLSGVLIIQGFYTIVAAAFLIFPFVNLGIRIAVFLSGFVGYGNIVGYVYLIEKPNNRNADVLLFSVLDIVLYILIIFTVKPNVLIGIFLLYCVEIIKCVYFSFKLKFHLVLSKETLVVLKKQLVIGFFPMLSLLLTSLNYKLDIIMLKNAQNITTVDVGVYSVAIAIAEKALLLPDALKEILISKLSKGSSYKEVVRINRIAIFLTLITACCISVFCEPVVNILFGIEYSGAVSLIRITTFGTAFMVIFKTVGSYNITQNKQVINLVFLVFSVATNLICNILLIPIYGTNGAAYATIGGFLVCGVMFSVYFCKTEHVNPIDFFVLKISDVRGFINLISKKSAKN